MSQPIVQTEALCSMTRVTAIDCKVPMKHTRDVRESGALYLLIVIFCSVTKKVDIIDRKIDFDFHDQQKLLLANISHGPPQ